LSYLVHNCFALNYPQNLAIFRTKVYCEKK
jgi:hypothetical protein